jgi:hypothetical protein
MLRSSCQIACSITVVQVTLRKIILRGFAPDIGTNVKFLGSVFFNFYFEEELGNYKGHLVSLGLFWSYKVLKLTFSHLNYFIFWGAGLSFVSLCEYTISNENYLLHQSDTQACLLTIYV